MGGLVTYAESTTSRKTCTRARAQSERQMDREERGGGERGMRAMRQADESEMTGLVRVDVL